MRPPAFALVLVLLSGCGAERLAPEPAPIDCVSYRGWWGTCESAAPLEAFRGEWCDHRTYNVSWYGNGHKLSQATRTLSSGACRAWSTCPRPECR